MEYLVSHVFLIPLGFAIGAYGTLVGAGGGFVLVPLLLFLYPNEPPHIVTSISLAVVFFNALSGSVAYGRQKRIDYRMGVLFATATVPGAVLGALATHRIPRAVFDPLFGAALLGIGALIFAFPNPVRTGAIVRTGGRSRRLTDSDGETYEYAPRAAAGSAVSVGVGFLSSLFGIGGGILHVPAMALLLGFPARIATATSQFTLTIMALTGTIVHIAAGSFTSGWRRTGLLALGVVAGAQFGAAHAHRVRGSLLLRLLSIALAAVGARLILAKFFA